jgi:hypothetical protein
MTPQSLPAKSHHSRSNMRCSIVCLPRGRRHTPGGGHSGRTSRRAATRATPVSGAGSLPPSVTWSWGQGSAGSASGALTARLAAQAPSPQPAPAQRRCYGTAQGVGRVKVLQLAARAR